MHDVLKNGYYDSPLGYDNVDCFVDEVIRSENDMTFYFQNNNKDIIVTAKDDENYRIKKFCRFCEKFIESDKVRDHCHLTSNYTGPDHNKCKYINAQKQRVLFHSYLTILVFMIVIYFSES